MIKKSSLILLASLVFTLSLACSFNPNDQLQSSPLARYADIKMSDSFYKIATDNSEPIIIEAKVIEIYKKEKKAFISNAVFNQYDENGHLLMHGSFGYGIINTDTNEMDLSKEVEINHLKEQLQIKATALFWDNKNQIVSSDEQNRVKLINKEHDILTGRGFKGDFSIATFEFQFLEEGVLVYD